MHSSLLTCYRCSHLLIMFFTIIIIVTILQRHCISAQKAQSRSELLCLGGSGQYGSSVSKYDGNGRTAAFARDCLLTAYQRFRKDSARFGSGLECSHARIGRCYCTVDYPWKEGGGQAQLKSNRKAAFYRALTRMAEATDQFGRLAAETFEGDMYITYLCTSAKSLHSKTKLSEQVMADTKTKVSKRLLGNLSVML